MTASRGDDYLATGGPGHGGGEEDAVTGLAVEEDAALLGVGGQHDTRLRVEHYGSPPAPALKLNTWLDPVRVRLTDTGVLLPEEARPGVCRLWDTRGVLVMVIELFPTLTGC